MSGCVNKAALFAVGRNTESSRALENTRRILDFLNIKPCISQ